MDDSDTKLYKWWDHVDRKETFNDISNRVFKDDDFASDEERIVEAMHILIYLYNAVDSKGTDEQDDWDAIRAVDKILGRSTTWKTWWEKNRKKLDEES
ncbi:MAG: hypothetical protein H8D50_00250 [Thaumarchaeota archaeon]|nr:hypothetical protein [Nitrososphaerota archaeon]